MASRSGFNGSSDALGVNMSILGSLVAFPCKISSGMLRWCVSITSHRYFDYVIGVIILVNSLLVGAEVELSLQGVVLPWMQPLDTAFIMVYCIEIGMRLVGSGWRACFADGWFLLDFVLVVVGVITTLALEILGARSTSFLFHPAALLSKNFSCLVVWPCFV